MQNAQFLVGPFAEEIALKVVVGREVDGGKRDVAQEAGAGALVEAHESKVLDDPHCGAARDVGGFGDFALDLEADLDDFEGIGEDLDDESKLDRGFMFRVWVWMGVSLRLDRRRLSHQLGFREPTRFCQYLFLRNVLLLGR